MKYRNRQHSRRTEQKEKERRKGSELPDDRDLENRKKKRDRRRKGSEDY